MLKRIIQTCAITALMASSALAANTGVFKSESADDDLVIELHQVQSSVIGGTIRHADHDYRLIAIENGDQLTGHWESGEGNIAFSGSIDGQTMTLDTNGTTYTLEKTADAIAASTRPEAPRTNPQAAEPPLETHEGRAFHYGVADGWTAKELEAGVVLNSRDGIGRVGHIFLFNPANTTPQAVFQQFLSQSGTQNWSNVKVESSTTDNQTGTPEISYHLTYTYNGTPVRATMVVVIYKESKRSVARVVLLQESAQAFSREETTMLAMAHEVEVTHSELVDPDLRRQQQQQQRQTSESGQRSQPPTPPEGDAGPGDEPAPIPEAGPKEVNDRIEAVIREQLDPPPAPMPEL